MLSGSTVPGGRAFFYGNLLISIGNSDDLESKLVRQILIKLYRKAGNSLVLVDSCRVGNCLRLGCSKADTKFARKVRVLQVGNTIL